jgi:hypothetical protein
MRRSFGQCVTGCIIPQRRPKVNLSAEKHAAFLRIKVQREGVKPDWEDQFNLSM